MALENQTFVTGFILLGFSDLSPALQQCLFLLLFSLYSLTLVGNLLVFAALTIDPVLHTPMYFFLRNLSFLETGFTMTTAPKTLVNLMADDRGISFLGCAFQMYFVFIFGAEECVLLGIMAYDRYVAICNPLRYSIVMSNKRCVRMAVGSWIMCVVLQFGQITFIFSLPFCRSKLIRHFFCDIPAVLRLSCTDTYFNDVFRLTITVFLILVPFLIILSSYMYIISTVLRMNSREGRSKAFSTCASHLTVVILFYGTALMAYLQSHASTMDDRIFALFYCFFIPPLNPLIYSLRSKEVKGALRKRIFGKIQFLCR
ncbi:olfactory receptor 10A4-like [Microcaecilia unicolor]|uniref:Olfactory receptor 10A4-like n=1 Tax=Microcaecilia unicolor TaxID=1415580 RepID=A0A6P7X121_9AMPH|nr:olfactory receptor 10A4-like [Microcaecilia unicolor]